MNIIRNMHEVKFSTIYLLFNITNDILPLAKVIVLVITVVGFKDCSALWLTTSKIKHDSFLVFNYFKLKNPLLFGWRDEKRTTQKHLTDFTF